jgi:hypothetical protein
MRFFYDTEFHEDGKTIDFISIGVVAEDGREFYAVSNEFDTRRVAQNKWLMDNVMSSIDHDKFVVADFQGAPVVRDFFVTDSTAKSKREISNDLWMFIGDDKDPEFWAWFGSYDHVCLAQLWGKMIDLPRSIPMFTNDIKTLEREYRRKTGKEFRFPVQPPGKHNALEDARWNVVRYDAIRKALDE